MSELHTVARRQLPKHRNEVLIQYVQDDVMYNIATCGNATTYVYCIYMNASFTR